MVRTDKCISYSLTKLGLVCYISNMVHTDLRVGGEGWGTKYRTLNPIIGGVTYNITPSHTSEITT